MHSLSWHISYYTLNTSYLIQNTKSVLDQCILEHLKMRRLTLKNLLDFIIHFRAKIILPRSYIARSFAGHY